MKISSKITIAFLLSLLLPSYAFMSDNTSTAKYMFTSYLGCAEMQSSFVPKNTFDSLVASRLCAKDSTKNMFPIQSFEITYAERGLYQDSSGLPIIFTDYSTVQCVNDTIPKRWVSLFKERSYKGDTVYFDNVKVLGSDNKSHPCKGLKIVIQ